jgi:hypothetical protein
MKRTLTLVAFALVAGAATRAQTTQSAQAQKSLAATMNIYVFPSSGQPAAQQSQDESECYNWAVKNTGTDPFQVAKQGQQQAQAAAAQPSGATAGSGARGAARGAASGALIGGIAGDAGKGAAIGAATGAVAGRSRSRRANAEAQQQQVAATQQATAEQIENFKKAFSVCLESKKYLVKY